MKDRLTIKKGKYYFVAFDYGEDERFLGNVIDRLGQYEDTGLTPEEIKEMKAALKK